MLDLTVLEMRRSTRRARTWAWRLGPAALAAAWAWMLWADSGRATMRAGEGVELGGPVIDGVADFVVWIVLLTGAGLTGGIVADHRRTAILPLILSSPASTARILVSGWAAGLVRGLLMVLGTVPLLALIAVWYGGGLEPVAGALLRMSLAMLLVTSLGALASVQSADGLRAALVVTGVIVAVNIGVSVLTEIVLSGLGVPRGSITGVTEWIWHVVPWGPLGDRYRWANDGAGDACLLVATWSGAALGMAVWRLHRLRRPRADRPVRGRAAAVDGDDTELRRRGARATALLLGRGAGEGVPDGLSAGMLAFWREVRCSPSAGAGRLARRVRMLLIVGTFVVGLSIFLSAEADAWVWIAWTIPSGAVLVSVWRAAAGVHRDRAGLGMLVLTDVNGRNIMFGKALHGWLRTWTQAVTLTCLVLTFLSLANSSIGSGAAARLVDLRPREVFMAALWGAWLVAAWRVGRGGDDKTLLRVLRWSWPVLVVLTLVLCKGWRMSRWGREWDATEEIIWALMWIAIGGMVTLTGAVAGTYTASRSRSPGRAYAAGLVLTLVWNIGPWFGINILLGLMGSGSLETILVVTAALAPAAGPSAIAVFLVESPGRWTTTLLISGLASFGVTALIAGALLRYAARRVDPVQAAERRRGRRLTWRNSAIMRKP